MVKEVDKYTFIDYLEKHKYNKTIENEVINTIDFYNDNNEKCYMYTDDDYNTHYIINIYNK